MVPDAELIARSLRGDPLAERALYDRHVDAVYRTAFRLSGDSDVAADYTQDTFIRAFNHLDQYRGDSPFDSWLRAIAASVALTGERKRARHRGLPDEETLADPRDQRAAGSDLPDRVATALDRMSEKLRSVFLMHDVEGYTHAEIGAALDIPAGTSKARLSEARIQLRAALSDYSRERVS